MLVCGVLHLTTRLILSSLAAAGGGWVEPWRATLQLRTRNILLAGFFVGLAGLLVFNGWLLAKGLDARDHAVALVTSIGAGAWRAMAIAVGKLALAAAGLTLVRLVRRLLAAARSALARFDRLKRNDESGGSSRHRARLPRDRTSHAAARRARGRRTPASSNHGPTGDSQWCDETDRQLFKGLCDGGGTRGGRLRRRFGRRVQHPSRGREAPARCQRHVLADTVIDGITTFGASAMIVRTSTRVKPGRHEGVAAALRLHIKEMFDRQAAGAPRTTLIPQRRADHLGRPSAGQGV